MELAKKKKKKNEGAPFLLLKVAELDRDCEDSVPLSRRNMFIVRLCTLLPNKQ